jgi:deazaflavin-dependent oxidoreductase (nitroreductase family)
MCRFVGRLGRRLLLVIGVFSAVFLVGMRTKNPAVQGAVRKFNRAFANPRQMENAGTPGAYASIVRHVGRSSGTEYETPVRAIPTDDGFAIVLPYGTSPDWLKNVLAAGSATIVHEGETHAVTDPELQPIDAITPYVSAKDAKVHRLFGIEQSLVLRRRDP